MASITSLNLNIASLLIVFILIKCQLTKEEIEIWGPGLRPHLITLPARYFFIRGTNSSLDIDISGETLTNRPCRIWKNVLHRPDNVTIARYKLYETCKNLRISVEVDGNHTSASPYVFNDVVYSEECVCPRGNLEEFLKSWECESDAQIDNDLKPFNKINFQLIRDKLIKTYDSPGAISLCHYVIKDNRIYRKCYGKHVGFKIFMDSILLSLSRKTVLDDLEFFVNLGDWPLVSQSQREKFPIFSWCGSNDTYDIVMPTYDLTQSTLENMGSVMLDMLSVQGNVENAWENRVPKLFWRGRDSNRERLKLIEIGREHPDLFDVALTNFFFFRDEQDKYGPKSEHVSFYKFFDYKYQLSIDGTVAPYRMPYLLGGGSLTFKQDSKYYEHFYNQLEPNVHYIPVKRDLSDLTDQIKWAMANDEMARKTAQTAQDFAVNHLLPHDIFCYHAKLLREFGKRLVSAVEILPDMELVTHKKEEDCGCPRVKDEL